MALVLPPYGPVLINRAQYKILDPNFFFFFGGGVKVSLGQHAAVKNRYCKTWTNDHFQIETTCLQRPLFLGHDFNVYNIKVWTTPTCRKWPLFRGTEGKTGFIVLGRGYKLGRTYFGRGSLKFFQLLYKINTILFQFLFWYIPVYKKCLYFSSGWENIATFFRTKINERISNKNDKNLKHINRSVFNELNTYEFVEKILLKANFERNKIS
jgi:hypothetical protein